MQLDNGGFAFVAEEELQRFFAVHKTWFRQAGCTGGVAEDVKGGLQICISVGVVEAHLVAGQIIKGGVKKQESKEKCDLVMSHTARRTGSTLMYLAGVDIYDIMKITGHTTPEMLKKYIKADQLDVVQKLTDKYDYFK